MRLVAISRIKNEVDIVEAFIRHTAAFVDVHLVLDNGSTDGTLRVMEQLASEGLPLDIIEDARLGHDESLVLTELMYSARRQLEADWVLPLDADEFLGVDTRARLEGELARYIVPVLVDWRTYLPSTGDHQAELNPVARMRRRLHTEAGSWSKVLVPGDLVERSRLAPGHHDVSVGGEPLQERRHLDGEVLLGHFPVRSPSQYAIKVLMGNLLYVARGGDRQGHGFHYEEPFRLLTEDWQEFVAGWQRAARHYAVPPGVEFDPVVIEDPFPYRGGELRYTQPTRAGEPWRTIIEYTAQLAGAIGDSRPNAR